MLCGVLLQRDMPARALEGAQDDLRLDLLLLSHAIWGAGLRAVGVLQAEDLRGRPTLRGGDFPGYAKSSTDVGCDDRRTA
eukprot:3430090-Rhodomonas_salina.2